MPERIARVVIQNPTSSLRLVKTFDHLCGGDWTPGGWEPPGEIGPGQTGGMQSESGGFLTGTEGYVKYDVLSPAGRAGMIYIYWDNPFFGVTHPRFATNVSDVFPDCDFDAPAGDSSTFVIDTSLGFHLAPIAFRHTHGGGDVTSPTDLALAFAVGPIGGIVTLFGLDGIVKDPMWIFELRDTPFQASGLTTAPPTTAPPPTSPDVAVPNVVGLDREEATNVLTDAGYQVTSQFTPSTDVGVVVRQQPRAGAAVAPPATVHLFVGGGPADPPVNTEPPVILDS